MKSPRAPPPGPCVRFDKAAARFIIARPHIITLSKHTRPVFRSPLQKAGRAGKDKRVSKPESKSCSHVKARREFTKSLAAMALVPLSARAGHTDQEPSAARPTQPQQTAADPTAPEADKLSELARLRYGKHLSEEQAAEVRRSIERGLRNADRLKQFKLKNGDEPAFAFSANP
jgi:hypothetical protein